MSETAPPVEEPVVDAEIVDEEDAAPAPTVAPSEPESSAIARYQGTGSTDLIAAESPAEKVEKATAIATALDDVIAKQGLRTQISGGRWHVNVEGWQTLATLLGVATDVVWTRRVAGEDGRPIRTKFPVKRTRYPKGRGPNKPEIVEEYEVDGFDWEAKVVVLHNGTPVGSAESMCSRSEDRWKTADDFAVRSMAQTRATSRAIATVARWIVTLAGYAGTPAEEMPGGGPETAATAPPPAELPLFAKLFEQEKIPKVIDALAELLELPGDKRKDAEGRARELVEAIVDDEKGRLTVSAARAILRTAVKLREAASGLEGDGSAEDPDAAEPEEGLPPDPSAPPAIEGEEASAAMGEAADELDEIAGAQGETPPDGDFADGYPG